MAYKRRVQDPSAWVKIRSLRSTIKLLFLEEFPEKTKENWVFCYLTREHLSELEMEPRFST